MLVCQLAEAVGHEIVIYLFFAKKLAGKVFECAGKLQGQDREKIMLEQESQIPVENKRYARRDHLRACSASIWTHCQRRGTVARALCFQSWRDASHPTKTSMQQWRGADHSQVHEEKLVSFGELP